MKNKNYYSNNLYLCSTSNNIAYDGRSFDFVHIYNYHRGMYHALVGSSYFLRRSYHILLIC